MAIMQKQQAFKQLFDQCPAEHAKNKSLKELKSLIKHLKVTPTAKKPKNKH